MAKLPHMADDDINAIISFLRSDDPLVAADPIPDQPSQPSFLTKLLCQVVMKPFPMPTEKIAMHDTTNVIELGEYLAHNLDCFSCHSADFKTNDFLHPEKTFLLGGELEQVHESAANKWILKESKWFKPDLNIIGSVLKDMFKNYKNYVVKGKQQGHYSRTNFSFDKMTELLGTYLDKYVKVPEEVKLQLPTLEKID